MKKRRTDNTMVTRKREGQTTQWPHEKEKNRQHNGQMKKRSTDNTMVTRKREAQTTQCPKDDHCVVCSSLFHVTIVLSVLLFFM
jgi:hypothetical protein